MTIEERMEKLLELGACIQLSHVKGSFTTLTLAGVLWRTRPKRLRWCAIFPEHQGHIHETRYTRAVVIYDRDIAFYRGRTMVAYVCPFVEAPLPAGEVRKALAEWWALLAKCGNLAEFKKFLEKA